MAAFEVLILTRVPVDVSTREVADAVAHELADDIARTAGQHGLYEPQIEKCEVECTAEWAAGDAL